MQSADWECHLVETVDEAQSFLRWLGERRPVLGVDSETTGLYPYGGDVLRMVQFGDTKTGWALDYRNWRGVVEIALRDYDRPVALWNAQFDMAFLEQAGLPIPPVHRRHDGMVMSHILKPNRSHALKQSGDRIIKGASAGQGALADGMRENKWDWATVPTDFHPYWVYACADVAITARLWEDMMPRLKANPQALVAYEREMMVQDIAYRMTKKGLLIDTEYTANLLSDWLTEMAQLEEELHNLGVSNPSAGQQVAQALQLTENWEPMEFTETGLPKTSEKVLAGIDSAIASKVIRYRRLRKFTRAYLSNFLEMRDANDLVHPDIRTLGARTGRMSIRNPALQTLPQGHEIRNCVVAPEGHKLLEIDYQAQEYRIFASYAGDEALIQAFLDGLDVHTYTASQAYGIPMAEVTPKQRKIAKGVGFGRLFGAGPRKIAETAGIPVSEAEGFIVGADRAFPGVPAFIAGVDKIGRSRIAEEGEGYIITSGGRRLPCDKDRTYALVNFLCQGSGRDVTGQKLVELDASGYGDLLTLTVHDSIMFTIPDGDEDIVPDLARIMEDHETFRVPLLVEPSNLAPRWGELK